MRARYSDRDGFVENDGVKIAYEVYEGGDRFVVFSPIDPIVQSRAWKAQVPYLARHASVVTIDPRGNGRSDRPVGNLAYTAECYAADTIAVMDAVGVERALLVGLCSSSWRSLLVASRHPERVAGVVCLAPGAPFLTPPHPARLAYPFDEPVGSGEGWARVNKYYWQRDYDGFLDFFFDQMFPEPHSTKQFEDCVGWARETTPGVLIDEHEAPLSVTNRDDVERVLRAVRCPVLAIHGDDDRCQPVQRSSVLAELTGGEVVTLRGAGHLPQARHPVVVNHLLLDFLNRVLPEPAPARRRSTWRTAATRRPRALFLSSPIGLGHARRDLAISQALRRSRPDVEVEWLTQHPVTELLSRAGESVHPASAQLASETGHIESECGEHDLDAFGAIRRMDEILVSNFMVFDEVVRSERYDLVVGDEAWDVDHFWHENPELKTAAFAWLTDFVGWLPFPDGGDREAALTSDYNAEMVEHVARTPRIRDRALFVGDPDDVVPAGLGAGLPTIREWTDEHFDYCGYVTGFEPVAQEDVDGVRAELGYEPGERVCVVSVGGSGVGLDLLRRAVAAYPLARQQVPGLRMVVVAGPRIEPATVASNPPPGLEVRPYVHDLWRHFAVCDLAVVQGGLTTTMELVAARRPFVYIPLRHHFEQQFHVAHRLDRHRAGLRLDYEQTGAEELASVITAEIGREVDYLPVPRDGAQRVASRLVDLL